MISLKRKCRITITATDADVLEKDFTQINTVSLILIVSVVDRSANKTFRYLARVACNFQLPLPTRRCRPPESRPRWRSREEVPPPLRSPRSSSSCPASPARPTAPPPPPPFAAPCRAPAPAGSASSCSYRWATRAPSTPYVRPPAVIYYILFSSFPLSVPDPLLVGLIPISTISPLAKRGKWEGLPICEQWTDPVVLLDLRHGCVRPNLSRTASN